MSGRITVNDKDTLEITVGVFVTDDEDCLLTSYVGLAEHVFVADSPANNVDMSGKTFSALIMT